jgi:threonine dehydratase
MGAPVTAAAIARAARKLRPIVRQTPVEASDRLRGYADVPVWLKREDLQLCRSYKVRGAYHLISSLGEADRRRGVVCASAGNHGQGVAYSCRVLGVPAEVFLPAVTTEQKQDRIAALGGDRVRQRLIGTDFAAADRAAQDSANGTGAVYVHPFDDPVVVAGQGTVAVEILRQLRHRVDTVVIPVGGGGLLAGMLIWLRHRLPQVYVVGAEPAGAASMQMALRDGAPVRLPEIDTFVDGAAVPCVGEIGYRTAWELLDELVVVSEDAVCAEMVDLYQHEGIIAEPAGALASAALRTNWRRRPRGPVVCVLSGGNNDIYRYGEIVERADRYGGPDAMDASAGGRPAVVRRLAFARHMSGQPRLARPTR